jgi:hypothetical protein
MWRRLTAVAVLLVGCGADEPAPRRDEPGEDASITPASTSPSECVRRDPRIEVSARPDEAVPAGTSVTYTLSIHNQNEASCEPEAFLSSATTPPGEGIRAEPDSQTSPPTAAGERATIAIVVTSGAEQEAGAYPLGFFVRSQARVEQVGAPAAVLAAQAAAEYVVAEPDGCHVSPSRELLIRHPSVVDDPVRTTAGGAWTFGHLLEQLSPSAADAPAAAEAMFRSFASPQTINGFSVEPRPGMESSLLKPWPRSEDGELDLARAPMRLLAIAHRLDLVDLERGRAGEGRFVYGVLDESGASLLFTVILEYLLPARSEAERRDWARAVHALQAAPFPSDAYNQALQTLTERYTARDAMPEPAHGSALLRIRTNENALGRNGQWEMREFHLSSRTGGLEPAPLAQTPDASFNGSARLARFIDANEASILRETHEVPATLDDTPFQAGALINRLDYWQTTGITSSELRHKFSLNTCDGCHGGETATSFFQVFPRNAGTQSQLSSFLTGEVSRDPSTGKDRTYNELARRRQLLEAEVCDSDG